MHRSFHCFTHSAAGLFRIEGIKIHSIHPNRKSFRRDAWPNPQHLLGFLVRTSQTRHPHLLSSRQVFIHLFVRLARFIEDRFLDPLCPFPRPPVLPDGGSSVDKVKRKIVVQRKGEKVKGKGGKGEEPVQLG